MFDWPRSSLRSDSTVCRVVVRHWPLVVRGHVRPALSNIFFSFFVDVPVVGLLVPHVSGIRLESCFCFPLVWYIDFWCFSEVSTLHISGKLLCCDFAFLVLVVEFSQESVSIWDFLMLGWLALAIVFFGDHIFFGSNTGGVSPALCST